MRLILWGWKARARRNFSARCLQVNQHGAILGMQMHRNRALPLPARGRAIAYDQLQPMVVVSHNLSAGRPCERRDPSPLAPKVKKGLCSSAEARVRAAAMSAIALTLGSLRNA